MSVINQVLNQLEQRGAQLPSEQSLVRPVQPERNNRARRMMLLVIVLLAAFAFFIWQTWLSAKPAVKPLPIVASAPASAVPPVATVTPPATTASPPPASRLSFELTSVPLPTTLRAAWNVAHETTAAKPAETPAKPTATPIAAASSPAISAPLPMKQISTTQQADVEFRKATASMQQGRIADALSGYEAALKLDAGHEAARQALVALLLESKRSSDAERILQEGIKTKPANIGFAMLLARLQIERGELDLAIASLEKSLSHADQQADYQAFYAALLQRKNRHQEAVAHYQVALRIVQNKGVWLMGYAISLQALARYPEAKEAYKRALETQTLSPELQAYVAQKVKAL